MGGAERQRISTDLLTLAQKLATERGYRLFGELSTDEVAEFGLEDQAGAHRGEFQVSLGGMLTALTSNGYEFIDINNDWDVDGTSSPQVRLAFRIFDAFAVGAFHLTHGWRTPNKYLKFDSAGLPAGRVTSDRIGSHRGGPHQRAVRDQ